MSEKELTDAGYQSYPPNRTLGDTWTIAYQKTFYNDTHVRYFLDVRAWDHTGSSFPLATGYEAFLNVNDGCKFFPKTAHLRIMIGYIQDWTVAQLEAVAKEIHDRLETLDYERQ